MSDCIAAAASNLQELGDSTIADFDRRIAGIPPELCAPFNAEAGRLENELVMLYKMVALCARSEADLDKVAASWARMVEMCDVFASRLLALGKAQPFCGADAFHDRVLDLRNKCRRLQEMHS